jgi:6-methylsalicylate decarboxylase
MHDLLTKDEHASPRRNLLKTLGGIAAYGALAAIPGNRLFAQKANQSTAKGGRIDVHHHFYPAGLPPAAGGKGWTPDQSLGMMDKFEIAAAILSMTQMADILYDGTEKGRKAVRLGNDYGAKCVTDHPKRFGLFAGVPMPDIDGVMKEIEYSLDTLKADGISIYTNDAKGRWPGDPYFEPMWKELDRRGTVVFIHQLQAPCCFNLNDGVPSSMNEGDFDITRACTSLLAGGVLHNYPNIKFIIPHSGGAMPMIAGRINDRYPHDPKHDEYIPNGVIPELQKIYVDIAHAAFPYPMAAMLAFAKHDHILFGTEYAAERIETTVNELPGLGLSLDLIKAIERGNAETLFPRFKIA